MENQNTSNQESPSTSGKLVPILFSSFFILIGVFALLILANSILQDPSINQAIAIDQSGKGESSGWIIAFLVQFGIVVPVITLLLSSLSIGLGLKLRKGDIVSARWAQIILLWMSVGFGLIIIVNTYQLLKRRFFPNPGQEAVFEQDRLFTILGFLVAFIIILFFYNWLKNNISRFFHGKEKLNSKEVLFAWNLLIPTLALIILVAARPLEQTFIRSLTDKRFASQDVPNFVGLENYQNLLGIRFDTVPCRVDEESKGCEISRDGSILWQSIDREKLERGFRTVWTIKLPFSQTPTGLSISGLDRDFVKAIWTTLFFTVISVSLELFVALFMALTVNSSFKGRGLMRAVMLVPWAIPTVISARLWELMLKDTSAGILNHILMDLRLIDGPQAWLSVSSLQIPSAIMVDVWKTAPFMALLLLAGLQTISIELYEAASVDGANRFQQFFAITLPLLRPTIAVALVFRTLDALRVFDLFNVLFGRQQLTMATYNYEMLVNNQRDGYASAVSMIIFLLISIFAILYVRMLSVETE
jgi:trehalose/maltose transport system permease protein